MPWQNWKVLPRAYPTKVFLSVHFSLQEAKDSSAIENIITTHDELYRADTLAKQFASTAAKEVHSYAQALRNGFEFVKEKGFISNNHILQIQSLIEENSAGFRKLPGTALKNEQTGETHRSIRMKSLNWCCGGV